MNSTRRAPALALLLSVALALVCTLVTSRNTGAQPNDKIDIRSLIAFQHYQAGQYREALALQRTVAMEAEKAEGKPAAKTAAALSALAWYALHARNFRQALAASKRAVALTPSLTFETNYAHALLLTGQAEKARALYLGRKGQRVSPDSDKTWEHTIADDFQALRKAGVDHQAFNDILTLLHIDRGLHQELTSLIDQFNRVFGERKYSEAITVGQTWVLRAREMYGENRTEFADAIGMVGMSYNLLGRFAEAMPLLKRALAIREMALGSEHTNVAISLNNVAQVLHATDQLTEAEQLYRRAVAINEKLFGPEHPDVSLILANLAKLFQTTNRLREAEPLYRRAVANLEKSLAGPNHPNLIPIRNLLATLLFETDSFSEAELLLRRTLELGESSLGSEHPFVADTLNNLAVLRQITNRNGEAEQFYRRALAIHEKAFGRDHHEVARDLNNLGLLLMETNRIDEAEALLRRALAIAEKSYGPEHPNLALSLNSLAALLRHFSRSSEVETLLRRSLSIHERSFGIDHHLVAFALNNLAQALIDNKRYTDAEPLFRRSLKIVEENFGPEHSNVARALGNLAGLLVDTDRSTEAEALFRRSLAIHEKTLGPEHPNVARDLGALAELLKQTNYLNEAEPLYRRALAINEKSFGPDHPTVGRDLNYLAVLRAELGDWAEAAALGVRAKPILVARNTQKGDRTGVAKIALGRNTRSLRAHARAMLRGNVNDAEAREQGFEFAQWALQTGAGDALAQMSARFAKGAGPLASVVRERQDLVARHQFELRRLDGAIGKADAKMAENARVAIVALDQRLDAIDERLSAEFPDYSNLANPKPVTIAAVQELIRPDEALVLFLDVPRVGKLPEETLIWVVTKETTLWRSIPIGTQALSDRVAALRCGLDSTNWETGAYWAKTTDAEQQRVRDQYARYERCKRLTDLDVSPAAWPPFDVAKSHQLYQDLLAPFAEVTKGKHLIIVPSGPLTSIPFNVLVTEPPDPSLTEMAQYQKASWLALQQPITVLPSVNSLQALRKLGPSQASAPYIAFGNPLLSGPGGGDKRAWDKQRCPRGAPTQLVEKKKGAEGGVVFRGLDPKKARSQPPLPETADELCAVGHALGALDVELDTIWLGERASEYNVKVLSLQGQLRRYRVVHFATHGLVSGESEVILKAHAEPALLLTPPPDSSTAAQLEQDDGLLMASEVAKLELDADWVVLSACNTAAGEKSDAEALAGLARAFFYAKARALLVSHWDVSSSSTVKLTIKAFQELARDRSIGRAEALRLSMIELIKNGKPEEAHPTNWAAFVLVGDDGR